MKPFCSIPKAIKELKKGNMLIVVDSPDRENQGDLIFPAESVTPERISFLINNCRGMICVAMTKKQVINLGLPLMVSPIDNTETTNVQFTLTVDAKDVTSFGISASDRTKTIKLLANSRSKPGDLVRPGHVFPLLARDGGVRERAGHTEATVELARLAGFSPVGALCEILNKKGEVAALPELIKLSKKFGIQIVSIKDLIAYVKNNSSKLFSGQTVVKTAFSTLPTDYGVFQLIIYRSILDNREHIVLRMGKKTNKPVLTRIHSQCITGDTFSSRKCDCGAQLDQSLRLISKDKQGLLIYLNQEGRGIGLTNKIKAYALQEEGLDTVEANEALGLPIDAREYGIAAEILHDLNISKISLLTNNPQKAEQLRVLNIDITQHPLEMNYHKDNKAYLKIKKEKLGHLFRNI